MDAFYLDEELLELVVVDELELDVVAEEAVGIFGDEVVLTIAPPAGTDVVGTVESGTFVIGVKLLLEVVLDVLELVAGADVLELLPVPYVFP